ncbi:hypothetical protein LTR37_016779 [Vermiconidia calcicola]|uniref:Uncharacterized protein n=1 Tax=Vermiconidia calcicola TaxID=1690605 RepID=A0ACC3MM34_9PEZI|nr:hypothetical protein LTR37_016779 [Vermiconidia calcicola]
MAAITSIRSLTLDLPPSCIAFCPTLPQYFVVGTYFLHPEEEQQSAAAQDDEVTSADEDVQQKRSGSLILFRLEGDEIIHVVTKTTDFAVLEAQWTPHNEGLGYLLAVATSTGQLVLYRLETTSDSVDLIPLSLNVVADPSVLVLSLAWHPKRADIIGITLSNGDVSLCTVTAAKSWSEDASISVMRVHHHELEAWTLAFTGPGSTSILSGGDDVALQHSLVNFDEHEGSIVQWRDRKLHQAGVTAILPLTSDLVVTGSYDDHIRLIACSAGARRYVLAELNLGGGVWRLRILAASESLNMEGVGTLSASKRIVMLASCMHAGARVVRLHRDEDGSYKFEVVAVFEEHQSMNYGSDARPSSSNKKSIISTSFYDRLLCLWRFDVGSVT